MLFPSVDFDLMLFTTEMGHERPKQISIIVSNVAAIFFLLFFFTCSVILLKNMNVKYIIVKPECLITFIGVIIIALSIKLLGGNNHELCI